MLIILKVEAAISIPLVGGGTKSTYPHNKDNDNISHNQIINHV